MTVYDIRENFVLGSSSEDQDTVLLVDDDAVILQEMSEALEHSGITCRTCHDWQSTMTTLESWKPDLIVLDQRLGAFDTLLHFSAIRNITSAPVLFLTASRSEADRVIGLELGADDFLLKPISGRELVARVRVHLRRTHRDPPPSTAGQWRISSTERRIYRPDGTTVQLTSAEFDLLQMVATSPGSPVDRDALSRQVLRRPYTVDDRSLDNLVHQIRRKFGSGGAGEVIASIRNVGYVFRGFPEA